MQVAVIAMLAVLICFRMSAAEVASASCTVRLHPQASVKSATLILADIADVSGDDDALVAQLAQTPLGSITDVLLLSRAEVAALIRNANANPVEMVLTGADFTRVKLATRTPAAAEIAAVLKAHLASVTQWREDEIEIRSIENLKAIELPESDGQLRVVSRGAPATFRSALLSVETSLAGKPLRTFWVKADVHVRAQVVQVATPVTFHSAIKADDLREKVCDIEDPRTDYFRTSAEAIGKVSRRALVPGELLSRNSVEDAGLVRSGQTVRLTVESGSVRMTVLARALQSGKLGDPIKVRNMDSDRVITAIVTGRGEVRVAN